VQWILLLFSEKRFRFLVEWDPSSLIHRSGLGWLPLHSAAFRSSIRGFRSVFEAGIKYFPNKKAFAFSLMFHKNNNSKTPFQGACEEFGYDEVAEIVEDTLIRYSDNNITETLIMAITDKNIHLDCVYFLLRREPDILHTPLSSKQAAAAVVVAAMDSSTIEATNNKSRGSKRRKRKRGTQKTIN
jgi:hypothetical protein